MGLFDSGKKNKVQINEGARCCSCRKRIGRNDRYSVMEGKLYCEKCGRKKRDWDAVEFALIMEDD